MRAHFGGGERDIHRRRRLSFWIFFPSQLTTPTKLGELTITCPDEVTSTPTVVSTPKRPLASSSESFTVVPLSERKSNEKVLARSAATIVR